MRGHKWKILALAMASEEVTSRDFAGVTGLVPYQTLPYASALVVEGYLAVVREEPMERGGRPMKIFRWTGKVDGNLSRLEPATPTIAAVVVNCFDRMVRCRERDDARPCPV